MRKGLIAFLGVLLSAAALKGRAPTAPLKAVEHVDLNRYVGKWYEIARYPNRFERDCDRDVTAEYSLRADGKIRVVNSCITAEGRAKQSIGTAIVTDKTTSAKLKVTFFWPFYGKYWIIDLGENYEYAVVGEPSRKYLWILGRSPRLEETRYQNVVSRLNTQGYEPAKLAKTTQTAR